MNRQLSFHTPLRALAQRLAVAFCFLLTASFIKASIAADNFQPLSLSLQPKVIQSPLPAWATSKVLIQPESDTVVIPVPALASQDDIGCFALTVVFQDHGDGGPVVEWQPKEGDRILLSAGLGETGIALGLNAHTLLISQSLALDGGTLRIGYVGRFARLISVTLRPAREMSIAALGSEFIPSLAEENGPLLSAADVSGADVAPQSGDRTEGGVIHAELSSQSKQLDSSGSGGVMEFIIPLQSKAQGSLLQAEIGGLDPESQIEVSLNGESLGVLGAAPFSMNSPSALFSSSGRLLLAGWRPFSLILPARLWQEGDNSIVLTLHRVAGDEGQPVYLRKTRVDLLFSPISSFAASAAADTLSTGAVYGNPSPSLFHAAPPMQLY